ncbi:hypothetical protein OG535_04510 [Kitasatospora sp. NBC_00085]|uniref:hypothetical protein n=1 Tax=unclassified Kitasatospora TaxID=2633591 RepID=UPI003247DCE1
MALRKSATVDQVTKAVARDLPTDRPVVTLGVLPGGNMYWPALIGGTFDDDRYFLTLTDRSLAFHDIEPIRFRPRRLVHVVPRAEASQRFGLIRLGVLWNRFGFVLPGDSAPTRMNVRRAWKTELDRLVTELTTSSASGGPGARHGR